MNWRMQEKYRKDDKDLDRKKERREMLEEDEKNIGNTMGISV